MESRPNILFITSDQWRGDCLSVLDHPCIHTPHYDALVADGVLFRNHYSVCAPCAPARASLLTGMYLLNHRVVRNGTPLDDRFTNIARELRRADYRPTLFGYTDTSLDPRVHDSDTVIEHGYENILPGFEEGLLLADGDPQPWLRYLKERGYPVQCAQDAYRQVDGDSNRGRSHAPTAVRDEDSQTAFLSNRTIDFIAASEPGWCVHLSYLRPHPPFVASADWHDRYDADRVPPPLRGPSAADAAAMHPWLGATLSRGGSGSDPVTKETPGSADYDFEMRQIRATYFGLVSKVDHYIGKLIDYLKASNQYENTVIVLTADHGELLGDHWLFGKTGYFDSAYHIPLIIRDPRQPSDFRGHIESAFTESVDVMPTLLDLLGREIPRQCDGYSLLPYMRGERPDREREELHWEYDFREIDDDSQEFALGIGMDECQMNTIRNQRYKYVHFTNLPPLFFDLERDPAQTENLAGDPNYASEQLEMQRRMLSWRMRNDERTLTHMQVTREAIRKRR